MNRIAMTILIVEVIVIGLSIPVAISISEVEVGLAWALGGALMLLAVLAAGAVRRGRPGYVLGTVVQVAGIAMGFVVPTMFFVGAVFALLWFVLLKIGPEVEAAQAARAEQQTPG